MACRAGRGEDGARRNCQAGDPGHAMTISVTCQQPLTLASDIYECRQGDDKGSNPHPHLPLRARSVRSVSVRAVFDGNDGDLALPIIDAVNHAVVTTASAVQPFEA